MGQLQSATGRRGKKGQLNLTFDGLDSLLQIHFESSQRTLVEDLVFPLCLEVHGKHAPKHRRIVLSCRASLRALPLEGWV